MNTHSYTETEIHFYKRNIQKINTLCIALSLAAFLFAGAEVKRAHAAVPPGFQTNLVIGSGLTQPTGFGIAPDGRIFILEQSGNIWIYKNGKLLPEIFDQLPSFDNSDRGLLGIAFDPDFNTNHFVYFYYVDLASQHRVVRFNAEMDMGMDGPVDIYKSGAIANGNHAGGTIQFGPDGKLYISIGESGNPPNAQNLSNPLGKILRINKDGTIPQDNPFVKTPGARPEIWAYGFRNPFRFQFDSATGNLYEGDVGEQTWEEVNHVVKGGNYGWPLNEGKCTANCANFIDPIYFYPHTTPGFAVVGGPVYHGAMFPPEYQGRLFIGDYGRGFIRTLSLDANGAVIKAEDFDTGAGAVTDMKVAPDGSLYYSTIFPGKLFRVTFNNGNLAPIAVASSSVSSGNSPLTVNFSAQASKDPEGKALTYAWDFGDGTTASSSTFTKVYAKKGVYTVSVNVSDGVSTSLANPMVITVGIPPTIAVTSPTEGQLYKDGDTISYAATGADSSGAALPPEAFTREVIFHHNTHIHPFIRSEQSQSGTFDIPNTGESSADTHYEVRLTATDSDGLSTTKSINILPKKVNLTFNTVPANLQITLGGIPQTTPLTIPAVQGYHYDLNVPDQQNQEFASWSDGGAKLHTLVVPDVDTTYTATLRSQQPFVGEYFTNKNVTGTPAFTRNDQTVNFDFGSGSPDPRIPKDGFSIRWTKNENFEAGRYKFITTTDDGARLFVDGKLIIDGWIDGPLTSRSAVVDLVAGVHAIKMEYYDSAGGAIAHLDWDLTTDPPTTTVPPPPPPAPPPPPPPPPSTSFKGEYFNNMTLSGTSTLVRDDSAINFNFGNGSPDSSIHSDGFSARWTKQQDFAAGRYKFVTTVDDGVRLFIDGKPIIDDFIDEGQTSYFAVMDMSAGVHEVKMEYYDDFGGAVAKLSWATTTDPVTDTSFPDFKGEYFANRTMAGTPVLTRNDPTINFDFGTNSPGPGIPADNFSARWTKVLQIPTAGAYDFSMTADDGARLYLDGIEIIDQWNDHSSRTFVKRQTLSAGTHTLRMEYYEAFGGAVAKLSFAPVVNAAPPFTAQYFNNKTLDGAPVLTRQESLINNFWGLGSPDSLVHVDNFSARWQRTETFTEGTHTFTIIADDGARLFIDGKAVIDQFHEQNTAVFTAKVNLTAGPHDIKMEYFESGGGAIAALFEN